MTYLGFSCLSFLSFSVLNRPTGTFSIYAFEKKKKKTGSGYWICSK